MEIEKIDDNTIKVTPEPVTIVQVQPSVTYTLDALYAEKANQQAMLDGYTADREADITRIQGLIDQAEALGVQLSEPV